MVRMLARQRSVDSPAGTEFLYNNGAYNSDLKDGSVGVGMAFSGVDGNGNPVPETHFLILPAFIQKYKWKFTARSYVAFSCCSGMSTQAACS